MSLLTDLAQWLPHGSALSSALSAGASLLATLLVVMLIAWTALGSPAPVYAFGNLGKLGSRGGFGSMGSGGGSTALPVAAYSADLTSGAFPAWVTSSTRGEASPIATYFDINGDLQTASTNAPRFGYDFFARTPIGYLSELASTNLIRNNTMQGIAAGTPGTAPNNWSVVTNSNGLSTSIATGTTRNMSYIDFRVFGTSSNANSTQLYFEATNNIATTTNQHRTVSAYLAIQAGNNANVSNISIDMDFRDVANAALGIASGLNIYSNVLPSLARFSNNLFSAVAGVAFSSPLLTITPSGTGVAVDITIRITMPQLEQAISSAIATTTAAVTRNADSAQLNATVAAILTSKIYAVAASTANGFATTGAVIGGSGTNVGIGYLSPFQAASGALVNTLQVTKNWKIGISSSLSARAITNNGGALNGGTVASDASPISIGPYLGNAAVGGFYAPNSGIATLDIWDKTLTNAQLQTVTLPANPTTVWGDSLANGTGSFSPTTDYGFVGFLTNLLGPKSVVFAKAYSGQASSFIATQMLASTLHLNDTTIIEVGRNNTNGVISGVIANIQSMIDHLTPGNSRYVVLSVINQFSENSAAAGASLTAYNWVLSMNAAMAAAFPGHYLDVRSPIVIASGGANDAPAASYLYQTSVHPNDAGYQVMATQIKNFGNAAGWPGY